MTSKSIKIAIAGLGTVGAGVIKILEGSKQVLGHRGGSVAEVVAVSARDRSRDRGVDLSAYEWCDNPVDLAGLDTVDLVVELIGGSDGPALALARETLKRGKAFVTANKALIAMHGRELAELAEANDAHLRFEAAVAGGIPIVKALREGLAANTISGVYGILNGTCNYILTRMEREGLGFDEVLQDAQRIGYAEADPTFDIDGIDTAHKTAILAAIAFGQAPTLDGMPIEGIRNIAPVDIDQARDLGYRIKLLGVANRTENGIETRVHPAMVPVSEPLAQVHEATNAVVVQGDYVGQTVYVGAGAGEGPTASAVVADIVDVLRGSGGPVFGVPVAELQTPVTEEVSGNPGTYYIRLSVKDEPGVMATITSILGKEQVSINSLIQRGCAVNEGVYIVMTTHETSESAVKAALSHLTEADCVLETPTMLRIQVAGTQ
ncbi:homoserine dehydrogenase [Kordiimonas sediminis]|uniref:Homoserine dehydrogenase n=1 Tax=Kordiimonas sediminis TaxID=1735581 RepID=A0A919AUD9_9PROT|nr:homoserine dehydrogenase [Kordiimonas sediminis]GHF26111.1 homoserine dehydrogenase [Kordiimonas sediminis]